ncbi:MAG: DUF1178 family protein [Alphaproteobacteria bacterium]|nr:DUF1178 family protein [Alphaproteobacteria bacterium]
MIRYDLRCDKGHVFEEWFDSISDYESLEAKGAIPCPDCGSHHVSRGLMAPNVAKGAAAPAPACGMAAGGPGCGSCAFAGG